MNLTIKRLYIARYRCPKEIRCINICVYFDGSLTNLKTCYRSKVALKSGVKYTATLFKFDLFYGDILDAKQILLP